jgi:hypothetical protein
VLGSRAWRAVKRHALLAKKTTSTRRYTLTYQKLDEKDALALAARADDIHDRVAAFLGAQPLAERSHFWIVSDDSGDLEVSGRAVGKAIAIRIGRQDEMVAVLGHETAHVYLNQLAEGALEKHHPATMLFNEGVAKYVEIHLFGRSPYPVRMQAANLASRTEIRLPQLLEGSGGVLVDFGHDAIYPLGDVFVSALVAMHGEAAIGQIARAMATVSTPADVADALLLPKSFEAAHLDFAGVAKRFDRVLAEAVSENKEALSRFPRLLGRAVHEKGRIVIRIDPTPSAGDLFLWACKIRAGRGTPALDVFFEQKCAEPEGRFASDRFEYQLCWVGVDKKSGVSEAIDICEPYVDTGPKP